MSDTPRTFLGGAVALICGEWVEIDGSLRLIDCGACGKRQATKALAGAGRAKGLCRTCCGQSPTGHSFLGRDGQIMPLCIYCHAARTPETEKMRGPEPKGSGPFRSMED